MTAKHIAVIKRARHDARHCGDACGHWQVNDTTTICIADGLGHGKEAEIAAQEAMDYVAHHTAHPLPEIFAGCNARLRSTRGVAMGIAVVDNATGSLTYAGVGNTRAMVAPASVAGMPVVSFPGNSGIVGGGYRSLSCDTALLRPGDLVILTTDGLDEYIDLSLYDAALRADVKRLAEQIMRDWRRDADDAAVLVFRHTGGR